MAKICVIIPSNGEAKEAGAEKNTDSHPEVMMMKKAKTSARSTTRSTSRSTRTIPGVKALGSISDRRLLSRIRRLSDRERETVLSILVHLVEIDRRQLYVPLGFSSLYKFCVKQLGYCEATAARRVAVARCISRPPLAYRALEKGGNIPCVLNAANEVAVNAFLDGILGFFDMPDVIEKTMNSVSFMATPDLNDYIETDSEARKIAGSYLL